MGGNQKKIKENLKKRKGKSEKSKAKSEKGTQRRSLPRNSSSSVALSPGYIQVRPVSRLCGNPVKNKDPK
jgi:hypothetical protein